MINELAKTNKRQKGADEVFCRSCGEAIKKEAEICPHCGVRQKGMSHHGKSKTTAVLLAIFLAPFNWLYTYKKDAAKFWIALILDILFTSLFIASVSGGDDDLVPLTIIVWFAIWFWAIIDASIKDREWYEDF